MDLSGFDQIVLFLHEASGPSDASVRCAKLKQVTQCLIKREKSLLDNFFEEVVSFKADTNHEIRKIVVEFIKEACALDPTLSKKAVDDLYFLLSAIGRSYTGPLPLSTGDSTLMRLILSTSGSLYRLALTRAVKVGLLDSGLASAASGVQANSPADQAFECFRATCRLKDDLVRLTLPSCASPAATPSSTSSSMMIMAIQSSSVASSDAFLCGCVDLVETVILLQSRRPANSLVPSSESAGADNHLSLDQVPDLSNAQLQAAIASSTASCMTNLSPVVLALRPYRLAEECDRLLTGLLDWPTASRSHQPSSQPPPITLPVLDRILRSCVNIASQRPQYLNRILQAIETLHVALPPHFKESDVSATRQKLKSTLLQLLHNPSVVAESQGRIIILLTDLGATKAEVMQALRFHETSGSSDSRSSSGTQHQQTNDGRSLTSGSTSLAAQSTSSSVSSTTPVDNRQTDPAGGDSLHFDDEDDDEDDDDINTEGDRFHARSKRRRSSAVRRMSSTTSLASTTSTHSAIQTVIGGDGSAAAALTNTANNRSTTTKAPSIEKLAAGLQVKLTPPNVADLVLLSMVTLPDQMPATFQSTYTPIAAAGTSAQIGHLARLLAAQLMVWYGELSSPNKQFEALDQLDSLTADNETNATTDSSRRKRRDDGSTRPDDSNRKRRRHSSSTTTTGTTDAEAEDAIIRANAARRFLADPGAMMNISTLIGFKADEMGLVATFDPSKPPPLEPDSADSSSAIPVSQPSGPLKSSSAPVHPAKPFSLDAIQAAASSTHHALSRVTQRHLALEAFLRILTNISSSPSAAQSNRLGGDSTSAASHLDAKRIKVLTRLTTRRFGGNEFYQILIDNAVDNLRLYGFDLLSRLLMQEYCRYRGFQLVGFQPFLEARRSRLIELRQKSTTGSADDNQATVVKVTNTESDDSTKVAKTDSADESMVEEEEDVNEKGDNEVAASVNKNATPYSLGTCPDDLGCLSFYECLLIDILQRLTDPNVRQTYFGRFLVEAPLLTPGAISVLKRYCWNPSQAQYGFQVLRALIELRPIAQREDLVNMLLQFCAVDDSDIRQSALTATLDLARSNDKWQQYIEEYAIDWLGKLLQSQPNADVFPFSAQLSKPPPSTWSDESCQACTSLFLGLMSRRRPALIHKLGKVYVDACPSVKRSILRLIDQPIRQLGIYSQDLHDFVDQCPVGAETLVTRMIHLLTDSPSALAAALAQQQQQQQPGSDGIATGQLPIVKGGTTTTTAVAVIMPPQSLVDRVYRLYQQRIHDVRSLIPVMVGLPKRDIIQALPRLVQLNEKVVKEVLTRLLNASVSTQYAPVNQSSFNIPNPPTGKAPLGPIKPEELLAEIHMLEFVKNDQQLTGDGDSSRKPGVVGLPSILHACRICFTEHRLFTQDRLTLVIGRLFNQPILPTLLMRTVMQSLALHPRLSGYVISCLAKLIRRQVWNSEKLWDGFIRCCVKTRPQSYQILIQLPAERLESVFEKEPHLRAHVRRYVENFSSAQRLHVSSQVIDVLEKTPVAASTGGGGSNGDQPNNSNLVITVDDDDDGPREDGGKSPGIIGYGGDSLSYEQQQHRETATDVGDDEKEVRRARTTDDLLASSNNPDDIVDYGNETDVTFIPEKLQVTESVAIITTTHESDSFFDDSEPPILASSTTRRIGSSSSSSTQSKSKLQSETDTL